MGQTFMIAFLLFGTVSMGVFIYALHVLGTNHVTRVNRIKAKQAKKREALDKRREEVERLEKQLSRERRPEIGRDE